MPLFRRTKKDLADHLHNNNGEVDGLRNGGSDSPTAGHRVGSNRTNGSANSPASVHENPVKPKLVFQCQQAQGSPTGIITGFTNVKELYQKIADCYDFPASDILFCTLNTHKVDMTKLLGGQIGLEDFIFVHRKGQAKEIEICKTEEALGLTITDNGAGYAFIKRIKETSLVDQIKFIQVGDHIEKIDDTPLVGWRHFEVAKLLKEIPKGKTFTMRLIEPLRAGFANIGPRTDPRSNKKGSYGSGKETLRLRSKGPATVQEAPDDVVEAAVEKINNLLESFMGINDVELATQIWELGQDKGNTHDFAQAIDCSDLEAFGFTDDFVFDLWGAISDAKAGRLKKDQGGVEQF